MPRTGQQFLDGREGSVLKLLGYKSDIRYDDANKTIAFAILALARLEETGQNQSLFFGVQGQQCLVDVIDLLCHMF